MPNNRTGRINEQVLRALSVLLPTVKDPRISGGFLSILRCEVTNDLRWCTVYISVLGDFDEKQLQKGLKSASPYLRHELAQAVDLRYTPELIFKLDNSIAHGAHISKMLDEVIK